MITYFLTYLLLCMRAASPPCYQATETGLARLPPGGQGNDLGERRGQCLYKVRTQLILTVSCIACEVAGCARNGDRSCAKKLCI